MATATRQPIGTRQEKEYPTEWTLYDDEERDERERRLAGKQDQRVDTEMLARPKPSSDF